jgi:hypothetical protein
MRDARHPIRAVALAGAAVCTVGSGVFVQPAAASVAVCGGLPRCHEVARVDVNGDGTADRVALVRRGGNRAEHGSVTVRVKTSPTHVESARRRTFFWSGGLWQGAGTLDGRPGRELVVGHAMGAHAEFFWVFTWRHGRLVTLRAPGGDPDWGVDGAANDVLGWQRLGGAPAGQVRHLVGERQPDGRMKGTVTTYQWTPGRWVRQAATVVDPLSRERAGRWVGWHVQGVARY